jgi:hypothetical protein
MDEIVDILSDFMGRLDWDYYDPDIVRVRVKTDEGWEYLQMDGPTAELLIQIKEILNG